MTWNCFGTFYQFGLAFRVKYYADVGSSGVASGFRFVEDDSIELCVCCTQVSGYIS